MKLFAYFIAVLGFNFWAISMLSAAEAPIFLGQEKSISSVSDDSLTRLYRLYWPTAVGFPFSIPYYIPKSELIKLDGNPIDAKQLEELFTKHNIEILRPFTNEDVSILLSASEKEKEFKMNLKELSELLRDVKTILKSFLLKNNSEFANIEENYIEKKGALRRLFTYAKLQRVIEEKKLSHIKLPRKILSLKDQKTNRYISSSKSERIIDDMLKVYVGNPWVAEFSIGSPSIENNYDLIVFAHKERSDGIGFNNKTMQELNTLCQQAPFDIGYDNIFHDRNGDAIIIDTEYKETSKEDCKKLIRYPIDPSL